MAWNGMENGMERKFWYKMWKMREWNGRMEDNLPYFHKKLHSRFRTWY